MENLFHDKSLSESHLLFSSVFDQYQTNLDKLSDDIKNLEIFFNSKSINIPFSMELGNYEWPGNTGSSVEFLCWEKFEEKFRLIYKTRDLDYNLISGNYNSPEEIEHLCNYSSKPLIQTKIQIRKKAKEKFSEFYIAFAKELSVEPLFTTEDIPF